MQKCGATNLLHNSSHQCVKGVMLPEELAFFHQSLMSDISCCSFTESKAIGTDYTS